MKSIFNTIYRTFDFKGRSSRKELIYYILFLVFLSLILLLHELVIFDKIHITAILILWEIFREEIWIIIGIILKVRTILLIPLICLSIRRLHDINLSGLYMGVPAVILFALTFIEKVLDSKEYFDYQKFEYVDPSFININSDLVSIIILIGLIVLCLKDSDQKDNKHGKYIP